MYFTSEFYHAKIYATHRFLAFQSGCKPTKTSFLSRGCEHILGQFYADNSRQCLYFQGAFFCMCLFA